MYLFIYSLFFSSDCNCSLAGSIDTSMCSSSGDCNCKDNVIGSTCDTCTDGTFNLQPNNELGCQPCYCSGVSDSCTSAPGYAPLIIISNYTNGLSDWQLIGDGLLIPSSDRITISNSSNSYLSAPASFLGNRLSSYGQYLYINYSMSGYTDDFIDIPLIRLMSYDRELSVYYNDSLPIGNGVVLSVHLNEGSSWDWSTSTSFVVQSVLHNLTGLFIRGSLSNNHNIPVTIHSISLESTAPIKAGEVEVGFVESCDCLSPNYTGLSCESCSDGYTLSSTGSCVACDCNELASTCNPLNGVCINCSSNTQGDHCQYCLPGYYGDPLSSVPCLPCPCPLTTTPGQYSPTCELTPSGDAMCNSCQTGHVGNQCEACAINYYGDPTGDKSGNSTPCTECMCNSNIYFDDWRSCDNVTGICSNCLFNTTGDQCERCSDGFYGDATLPMPPKCFRKLLIIIIIFFNFNFFYFIFYLLLLLLLLLLLFYYYYFFY